MTRLLWLAAWVLLVPLPVQAQADFSSTDLATGQRVRVTSASGLRLEGIVTNITPTVLGVDGRTFQPEAGLTVERLGDSIWNGIAIGFGVGALLGAAIARTDCFDDASAGCVWKPGIAFGVIGALVDRTIVGSRTVFLGRPVSPVTLFFHGSRQRAVIGVSFE